MPTQNSGASCPEVEFTMELPAPAPYLLKPKTLPLPKYSAVAPAGIVIFWVCMNLLRWFTPDRDDMDYEALLETSHELNL